MKQSKLLLLFVLAFAMLFAGCANSSTPVSNRPQSPNSADSEAEEVSEPPKSTTSIAEQALVSVDYATDELLSTYVSASLTPGLECFAFGFNRCFVKIISEEKKQQHFTFFNNIVCT